MDGPRASQEKALYNIRLAKDADFEALKTVAEELNGFSGYNVLSPLDESNESSLHQWLLSKGYIVIAEARGMIVGVLGFAISQTLGSKSLMGLSVLWWIDPSHRNGMLSKELVSTAEQIAKMRGAKFFVLSASANNPPAVKRRYGQLGYSPMEAHFMKEL